MLPPDSVPASRPETVAAPVLKIKKILLPLDLDDAELPVSVVRQALALAHHFHAEILLLNVVRPFTYMSRDNTAREQIEQDVANEQQKLQQSLGSELTGIPVRYLLVKGDPPREIVRTAADRKIDLIVMPTHGYGTFESFLIGSVTAQVLHNGECPVWAGALVEETPGKAFAIRNILCAVDFSSHSSKTIQWARNLAHDFGAKLTLAHVTPGVEIYGPGGNYVVADMKQELVNGARNQMAKIQREVGTNAEVFIGSGDVPKVMAQAAKETTADLLVVGCRSLARRFGNTAYGIIRESRIPVFSI